VSSKPVPVYEWRHDRTGKQPRHPIPDTLLG
jgi:hypothetical protein